MTSTNSTGLGNPSRQSRRSKILQGATQLFAEAGYERASMETISHVSGVTKVTVYAHFHDKAGLFTAVMDHHLNALPQPLFEADPDACLREQLTQVARELLRITAHPAARVISQILAQSSRSASLEHSQRWQQRYRPYLSHLAQVLSHHCHCDNPALAAHQFLMLVIGSIDPQLSTADAGTSDGLLERAMAAVEVFVRAYPEQRQPNKRESALTQLQAATQSV